MLKIKDEVDLKELEKFGLKKKIYSNGSVCYESIYEMIDIDACSRLIRLYIEIDYGLNFDYSGVEILFDLIQAGLVEKV